MVYLRKKNIHGSDYWYLCRSKRVDGRVKQEVIKYLGSCDKISSYEAEREKKEFLKELEQE